MAFAKPKVSRDVPTGTSRTTTYILQLVKYYYVYVLSSIKRNFIYVGYSTDYKKRIVRHNAKQVQSTKHFSPLKLIFLEAYINKLDAKRRERYLKTTKGKITLRYMLKNTLH